MKAEVGVLRTSSQSTDPVDLALWGGSTSFLLLEAQEFRRGSPRGEAQLQGRALLAGYG